MRTFKELKSGDKFIYKTSLCMKVENPSIFGESDLNAVNLWNGKENWYSNDVKVVGLLRLLILFPLMLLLPGGFFLFFLT